MKEHSTIYKWGQSIPSMTENIIVWNGGERPVPIGTRIALEYRGCECLMVGRVDGTENWQHTGSSMDILAYKILSL